MSHRFSAIRAVWAGSTVLAAAATFGFAAPASAQDSASAEDEGQLATIIVTANRREENLQDVAVSADILDQERIGAVFSAAADITALAGTAPGLNVESSNGRVAPRFYIRGLGNTDFDLAASQPVSVLLDDVVLENTTLKSFPIFDVERVEILRGPQGTLFGRNTPAGAVKVTSIKPSHDFSAAASLSYGSYGTMSLNGAVGGSLAKDVVAVRLSGQLQRRNDWIDNGFTGQENSLGGYEDLALRGQLLFTPGERTSILAQINYRNLDGSSTFFRANVLGRTTAQPNNTNSLNNNYDRDRVFYDGGGGNRANYEQFGATVNASYEFDGATLTSITSYWSSEGSGRGDIDGGNLVNGPGFIPFPSDTQDSLDLEQFTQEIRLASTTDGPLSWQVGGFYFSSDFDVGTVGFNFPPPTTVNHTNEAWALFGQVSYQLTETLRATGGIRYTDDQKDFFVRTGPAQARSVQDDQFDWDISLFADVSEDASIYAKVANSFRGPTIQGRDVAFFGSPSVAQSENITSYEAGFKSEFADRRVRVNGAVYYYTVEDPQFTAVGGAGNLVQLINANKGEGYGVELDSAFQITPNFLVTLGVAYNSTEIQDANLAVGICAQCTVTDPTRVIAGNRRAFIDGNPFPNAPEFSGDFTARYGVPVGDTGEFFVFTDWVYLGQTNFLLYQTAEFNAGSRFEGGLKIGFSGNNGQWEVAAFARNITDEDNVLGAIDFNNNTAFVNEPRVIGAMVSYKY